MVLQPEADPKIYFESATLPKELLSQISSELLHVPSSPGRTKNFPSQPVSNNALIQSLSPKKFSQNSTSDFTIIEIIKPDKQKHDSKDFIPAFTKPPMMQDSSLESATLMNLRPLKTSYLQGGRQSFSYMASSSSVLATSPPGPPFGPFQSVLSHQLPPQSVILSSSGHGKVNIGLGPGPLGQQQSPYQQSIYHQGSTKQQSTVQASDDSSETNSAPDSPLLPLPITKSLTKLKVVFWVNELRRYLFLQGTGRMNSVHVAELHQLLRKIEDKMADPFLTPQILGETNLGKVMKSFMHGAFDARSKEVARHVVRYWRKVCLEA